VLKETPETEKISVPWLSVICRFRCIGSNTLIFLQRCS